MIGFFLSRPNRDPAPNPSPAGECVPPLIPGGGGARSPAGEGMGESQFGRLEKKAYHSVYSFYWRKSLALCLLCGAKYPNETCLKLPYLKVTYDVYNVVELLKTIFTAQDQDSKLPG